MGQFRNKKWDAYLAKKLRKVAPPITHRTQSELVAYYQDTYPGGKGNAKLWKQHLVADILALRGVTLKKVGEKEYKRQAKNLGKRFEGRLDKGSKVSPKNAEEYARLGKKLGVTGYAIPPGGLYVQWGAKLLISGKWFRRHFETTWSGEAAQALLMEPRWFRLCDAYFTDGGLRVVSDMDDLDSEQSPVEDVDLALKKGDYVKVSEVKAAILAV